MTERERERKSVCVRERERVEKKGRNFLGVKMAIKITAGYFSNLYLK